MRGSSLQGCEVLSGLIEFGCIRKQFSPAVLVSICFMCLGSVPPV
jgi:hypothetical protein